MKSTTFYFKGTNEKVRTSKTHNYTHYVGGCCCGSLELAIKARDKMVASRYPRETAEEILDSGMYKVAARKVIEARELLDWHDEQLGQEKGRELKFLGFTRGVPFYGAKATEKELENARKNIQEREEYRARLEIRELEGREK